MLLPLAGGRGTVVKFGEFIMILELHRQGLKVAAIARQLGIDRKTVRKYISRGLEPPTYGPRPRRQKSTDPFLSYLLQRLAAFPGLTAVRLWREMRERGYPGGYTAVKRAVRDIRLEPIAPFEVRFETPPGEQAQVDLARFEVEFADEPGVTRIVPDEPDLARARGITPGGLARDLILGNGADRRVARPLVSKCSIGGNFRLGQKPHTPNVLRRMTLAAGRMRVSFTQYGEAAVLNRSGHVYLVTNRHGQHRLTTLSRPMSSRDIARHHRDAACRARLAGQHRGRADRAAAGQQCARCGLRPDRGGRRYAAGSTAIIYSGSWASRS